MNVSNSNTTSDPTRREMYARADQRLRRGKQLVVSGCLVAMLGMVAYCAVSLMASTDQEPAAAQSQGSAWFGGASLGVVGSGAIPWLLGALLYLSGGLDSDPNGPDLYF
ncbi:MAG: hypothetical protein H6822_08820 [Planctomycetaceae bacterium]|nr:hypothetical protein [Planctomycetales bacterium]MCB9922271.1 hypothetical protein [Planctomycetaceae bacterium]